jgi:hypothetical protein
VVASFFNSAPWMRWKHVEPAASVS